MPLHSLHGRAASVVTNVAAPQRGPQEGQGPLPLCDLLYTSWGGAPPFSASDMQMYERWRCRTLALRSFSSSNEECVGQEEEEELKRGVEKPDKIEEEEARRAEGFVLLRRCLPRGLPMDLVERTAWAECFSFFCKRECLGGFRSANGAACALQPVSLPTLVARLAHRLWFLLPGGPHFFPGSLGGASLLDVLPPWVSFLCEELAAFFMFVLLHMKALIKDGTGVYVHLTDREWSARFRQVKWLLSLDCPPPSSPPPSSLNEEDVDVHASDAVFPVKGGKHYLDLPPLECIDTSLSEHFPTNPDSAPHSFWLLFDRRALSWVVCTESYALRRFPVYDGERPPSPGAPASKQKRRRPLPSLVDAAREDALRYLCMLGALPPSSLSGNTHYLYSLRSEADEEEEEEVASAEEQQQQQPQQQLLDSEAARECITDASTIHSELTPKVALPSTAAAAALNGHKRRVSEGPVAPGVLSPGSRQLHAAPRMQALHSEATAADTATTAAVADAVADAAADEVEELEHEAPSPRVACSPTARVHQNLSSRRHSRKQAATESDSEADVQVLEPPSAEEEEEEEKPSEHDENLSSKGGVPQKRKSNPQQIVEPPRHKRSKQPPADHQQLQQDKHKSKKPQQNCEKQKKAYICDASLKALTNRERLPFQREALTKALKSAGLIEHFMIDPRDLRDA
ncbi:hypothetical protein Emed_003624 [Eimeria media]